MATQTSPLIRACSVATVLVSCAWSAEPLSAGEEIKASEARSCPVSPMQDLLPSVIAPMAGEHPLWLVDSFGFWAGAETPHNLYWVVTRDHPGDLRVGGRRLDGPERARFTIGGGASPSDALVIQRTHLTRMIPGNASPEILREYAFLGGYALFPGPGCWELTARLGDVERRFVVELTPASRPKGLSSPSDPR